ncbi:hypothetical protein BCR34DRAFT_557882 [Clohesyomyces aquaticus]|uniref:Uncharacterized protein n=1 Tax=Clohesyomyces aquaticus TaxID=1231657 RepID=A0A1Y2A0L2_9PLEO|nr:hypothetical protein BCR34DRAFT_557882 [Clohesyomyces aquaticus]
MSTPFIGNSTSSPIAPSDPAGAFDTVSVACHPKQRAKAIMFSCICEGQTWSYCCPEAATPPPQKAPSGTP